jgi:MoxR-like ATPase
MAVGVVLVIGAPGVGKSLLASAVQEAYDSVCVCNVGHELFQKGLLQECFSGPTFPQKQLLKDTARSIVQKACTTVQRAATSGSPR